MLYLACNDLGVVVEIAEARNFKEAYRNTIGKNNGVFLVELDDETREKLKEKI